jgi:hypothetical protein
MPVSLSLGVGDPFPLHAVAVTAPDLQGVPFEKARLIVILNQQALAVGRESGPEGDFGGQSVPVVDQKNAPPS